VATYSLGIDIGGTFTDIVVYDQDDGRQVSRKVLTTHDDPARAVAAGLAAVLAEGGLDPGRFTRVVHATTLFTNALIERTGAPTGLITTAGFADTLEIGRERKFELYDLNIAKPEPLVPRNLRLEVTERLRADDLVTLRALTRPMLEFLAHCVKAKLNATPFATYIPKILKFDTSVYMLGWGVSTFDALYSLQALQRTVDPKGGADGSYNLGRYSNAKVDALIDGIKIETDAAKRDAMIRDVYKLLNDEVAYLPIHHQIRPWAMKKNISTVHRADDRQEAKWVRID
jgi:hypothetical protein